MRIKGLYTTLRSIGKGSGDDIHRVDETIETVCDAIRLARREG